MATFENPQNNHRLEVGGGDVVCGLLLGPLWLLFRGALGAGFGLLGLGVVLVGALSWFGAVLTWVVCAVAAQPAIRGDLLRRGYREVSEARPPQAAPAAASSVDAVPLSAQSAPARPAVDEAPEWVKIVTVVIVVAAFLAAVVGVALYGEASTERRQGAGTPAPRVVAAARGPAPGLSAEEARRLNAQPYDDTWPFVWDVVLMGCEPGARPGYPPAVWVAMPERVEGRERFGLNAQGRAIFGDEDPVLRAGVGANDSVLVRRFAELGVALCDTGAPPQRYYRRGR